MPDQSPTISVIMSVFNGKEYLADAVNSILNQTWSDFEFIVIDDGSTDGSTALLRELQATDHRIRLVHQQNIGLTASLNRAIHCARGEFIARMDSDDRSDANRFAAQLEYLASHPECVALGSWLLLIDPDGDALGEQRTPTSHDDIVDSLYRGIGALPHPSVLMRRASLERVGGYRESFRYAQDLDLWLRLSDFGKLANLVEPLLQYRLHPNSITSHKRRDQLAAARRAVQEACLRNDRPKPDLASLEQTPPSTSRIYRGWSRLACAHGYTSAARKHAWNAFKSNPYTPSHLGMVAKLVAASLRGSRSHASRAA